MKLIRKAGLLLLRDGRILLCRKSRGTQLLILPGGKYEGAETAEECIRREVREELGAGVLLRGFVGTYADAAAGEVDTVVQSDCYLGELDREPQACAEIAELVWFGVNDDMSLVSASLRNKILPDLLARGLFGGPGR